MQEIIKSLDREEAPPGFNPAGSRESSAPAGIFFLRRSRYFSQASARSGQSVRGAEIAEATGPEHDNSLPGP